MLGFVEYRDVRLDPVLIDQPVQHLGCSIGGVADQLSRIEIEAFERALDHALCRQHLGLTDRRRCFDIDDDRVVGIDQVVGRIGKERRPAVRRGPPRRRIGRCDELVASPRLQHRTRHHRGRRDILRRRGQPHPGGGGSPAAPSMRVRSLASAWIRLASTASLRRRPDLRRCNVATVSNSRRSRSLSRNRPCRFFEKVE
jgi:hypothetical protein